MAPSRLSTVRYVLTGSFSVPAYSGTGCSPIPKEGSQRLPRAPVRPIQGKLQAPHVVVLEDCVVLRSPFGKETKIVRVERVVHNPKDAHPWSDWGSRQSVVTMIVRDVDVHVRQRPAVQLPKQVVELLLLSGGNVPLKR